MLQNDIQVVHFIPGRVRIKSGRIKGDYDFAVEIRRTLSTIPGILKVETNPVTGSVLVLYDPEISESLDAVLSMAQKIGLLPPGLNLQSIESYLADRSASLANREQTTVAGALEGWLGSLDARVARATGGQWDLRFLVPVALFALGVADLLGARRIPFPPWYVYLWYTLGTYGRFKPRTTRDIEIL